MNADDVEPLAADVLELVRGLRADDEDVAGAGLELFAVGGDSGLAGSHDPGLRVRVPVQIGPGARLVVDEEERDARPVRLALERERAPWAALDLSCSDDVEHGASPLLDSFGRLELRHGRRRRSRSPVRASPRR